MHKFFVSASAVIGVIALIVFLSFIMSYPMMLLWNLCLVPAVSTLKEVGWLQMWGIVVLIGLMFKSSVSTSTKND